MLRELPNGKVMFKDDSSIRLHSVCIQEAIMRLTQLVTQNLLFLGFNLI